MNNGESLWESIWKDFKRNEFWKFKLKIPTLKSVQIEKKEWKILYKTTQTMHRLHWWWCCVWNGCPRQMLQYAWQISVHIRTHEHRTDRKDGTIQEDTKLPTGTDHFSVNTLSTWIIPQPPQWLKISKLKSNFGWRQTKQLNKTHRKRTK